MKNIEYSIDIKGYADNDSDDDQLTQIYKKLVENVSPQINNFVWAYLFASNHMKECLCTLVITDKAFVLFFKVADGTVFREGEEFVWELLEMGVDLYKNPPIIFIPRALTTLA